MVSFKKIFLILLFLFIVFSYYNVFAVTDIVDIESQLVNTQVFNQNSFISHSTPPLVGNTDYWLDELKPIFDEIKEGQYDYFVGINKSSNTSIKYIVYLFYKNDGRQVFSNYADNVYQTTYSINYLKVNSAIRYTVEFNSVTNSGSSLREVIGEHNFPACVVNVKTDMFINFVNNFNTPDNYVVLLNQLVNYLDTISSIDSDILTNLTSISSQLSSISQNTSTNYSQQIGQISTKISDILDDNQEIISQNEEMIQQQEDINQNLQDINETIKDDSIDSQASDLPSATIENPTENGLNNIFTSIYNAFCSGTAQDIVFPIPFTGKNITLSPYYVRDMLNNNGATWVYTLIQAFWGYLIGRYIIKDISRKITKMKSGDIENIQNTNIKEDML